MSCDNRRVSRSDSTPVIKDRNGSALQQHALHGLARHFRQRSYVERRAYRLSPTGLPSGVLSGVSSRCWLPKSPNPPRAVIGSLLVFVKADLTVDPAELAVQTNVRKRQNHPRWSPSSERATRLAMFYRKLSGLGLEAAGCRKATEFAAGSQ